MMQTTSVIELDASALRHNLEFLRKLFPKDIKYSSVVKGNAYGHGTKEFVNIAEQLGVDHFSVFSADEAQEVLEASKNSPDIMIMGLVLPSQMEWVIANDIEFFVFDLDRLVRAQKEAARQGKVAKVHVEIETGMNRTGFDKKEWANVANILGDCTESLSFHGLCTHFAGAESITNYVRIDKQKAEYLNAVDFFEAHGLKPVYKHCCCSAASIRFPEMMFDMLRIGILQYGFWPSLEVFIEYIRNNGSNEENPLKPIITWKTHVMSLKHVEVGDYIGYGSTYLAQKKTLAATVPLGYAHGFSRVLSNQGRVLIHGQRVPVIGMVNMNLLMVDVTGLPHLEPGDEVVIIGEQNNLSISVSSFGELSNQLNYELLTRLPRNIPRIII